MTGPASMRTVFVTAVEEERDLARAATMIDSLRTFGGPFAASPVWVFETDGERSPCAALRGGGTSVHALDAPAGTPRYPAWPKTAACSRAEEMAGSLYRSLVWLSPDCLVVAPPVLFDLDGAIRAALRPVHLRNVGSPAADPPDAYWRGILRAVGVDDVTATVESFVDCVTLRAYVNTHAFAVDPSLGMMGRWSALVSGLAADEGFQAECCGDLLHRVFLHQAVLSALIAAHLDPRSIRWLPEEYGYPYHLQEEIPADRRAETLNELVCITCEDRPMDPCAMTDILVEEPLLSWLQSGPGS